ncbi:hypothetical protein TEA_006729 [Camellia sinensis var. sinensis]|uniref:Fe2OG dioxygenase domain-containing protein n=1 Tax=Camellia sinensis var. sinensis TaxID=542762 RepID=A0A4V3WJV8_CAMSN|nr:hypothetical protein TEA_006729 [Camellia sinensis var. sinensis]
MKLIEFMAKALNMKGEEMRELFEEGMQSMRMNYHPPCPQPELVIGLTPHLDPVRLTILLQINEMEGLQIKKDGMWIPIKPLPNAFIMVTNGIYKSIEHRATVNSEKERLSIATFLSANLELEMVRLPALSPLKLRRHSGESVLPITSRLSLLVNSGESLILMS